jgi:hypothetical protein
LSGCTATSRFALFKNHDYADPTEGPDEKWISKVGDEGRGQQVREKSEEPRWFREMVMSDRAREIERNLGIDD